MVGDLGKVNFHRQSKHSIMTHQVFPSKSMRSTPLVSQLEWFRFTPKTKRKNWNSSTEPLHLFNYPCGLHDYSQTMKRSNVLLEFRKRYRHRHQPSFVSPLTPWGQTSPLEPHDFECMVAATNEQQRMSPQVETKVDDASRNPLDISQKPPRPSNIFDSLLNHCSDLQGIVEGRHQNPSMPAETEDLHSMEFSMAESITSSSGSVFASTKEASETSTLGQTNMLETMLLAWTTSLKIFYVC